MYFTTNPDFFYLLRAANSLKCFLHQFDMSVGLWSICSEIFTVSISYSALRHLSQINPSVLFPHWQTQSSGDPLPEMFIFRAPTPKPEPLCRTSAAKESGEGVQDKWEYKIVLVQLAQQSSVYLLESLEFLWLTTEITGLPISSRMPSHKVPSCGSASVFIEIARFAHTL